MLPRAKSRAIYVPSAVSSFFEICDTNPDGSPIHDVLKIGSRGGGFVLKRGSTTRVSESKMDTVLINHRVTTRARTTNQVIDLMRNKYGFGAVRIHHIIEPPIGCGFGTSGSGALGAAIAISDLFELNLSLSQLSAFAHMAEIRSVTGLGTVISLASGSGAVGLVTEPGSFSIGRVDSILLDPSEYVLICACFGPIEKSSVLHDAKKRQRVNEFGRRTLEAILNDPTPSTLLARSRMFAEKAGVASKELLVLSDKAVKLGAIGATQNMIGNAIHCLVKRHGGKAFVKLLGQAMNTGSIFVSELIHSGPTFV
jgi:pantoate kinase